MPVHYFVKVFVTISLLGCGVQLVRGETNAEKIERITREALAFPAEIDSCLTSLTNTCPTLGDILTSTAISEDQYKAICKNDKCPVALDTLYDCVSGKVSAMIKKVEELAAEVGVEAFPASTQKDLTDAFKDMDSGILTFKATCKCGYPPTDECVAAETAKLQQADENSGALAGARSI